MPRMLLGTALTLVALAVAGAPAVAQDAPPAAKPPGNDERIDRIEKELEKTKAELEALKREREGEARKAPADEKPGEAKPAGEKATADAPHAEGFGEEFVKKFGPDAVVTWKDGFNILFLDSDRDGTPAKDAVLHQVGVHGRLHVDYRGFFEHSYPTGDEFRVRRARIAASGFLFKYHEFVVEFDMGGFASGIRDAHMDFHYIDQARLKVGSHKQPFSLEQLISSRYIPFVERSFFNLGTSNIQYDIGVQLHGEVGPLKYGFGVYNGRGQLTRDDNEDKDVAGRLVLQPFKGDKESVLESFALGGSFSVGRQSSSPQDFSTYAGSTYIDFAPDVSQDGTRWRAGGDISYAVGPVYFLGEYFHMRLEDVFRGTGATRVEESGDILSFYVGAVLFLTGEKAAVGKRVYPKSNFNPFEGGTGAVALAARFDQLHCEKDFFRFGIARGTDQVDAVTLGVRWFLNPYFKVEGDFYKAWFDEDILGDERDEWGMNIRFAMEY